MAFTLYEEAVSESRAQQSAISLITGTLCNMKCFDVDSATTLRMQCMRAAGHLLRRPDQSRAVLLTSLLFWQPACPTQLKDSTRDAKGALICLEKATKLAEECMDAMVRTQLLSGILEYSAALLLSGCPTVGHFSSS
ncbi:unnamed protein product [Protopolystoma xenopodis]|uniref:Uncharacterized protein n=1 Tax=Protopolystoma xenopodis TaxID=117903 RepID=A0A448WM55_9PLAT|nr:unnamed protein product [Protopolystoma xenopodis]